VPPNRVRVGAALGVGRGRRGRGPGCRHRPPRAQGERAALHDPDRGSHPGGHGGPGRSSPPGRAPAFVLRVEAPVTRLFMASEPEGGVPAPASTVLVEGPVPPR